MFPLLAEQTIPGYSGVLVETMDGGVVVDDVVATVCPGEPWDLMARFSAPLTAATVLAAHLASP